MMALRRFLIGIGLTFVVITTLVPCAAAQLTIDSIDPAVGKIGEDLEVTITGSGFDANTRVSILLETGSQGDDFGSVKTPGNGSGISVVERFAFIADGDSGLQVIDVRDWQHPTIVGSVGTPGYAEDITVVDNIAYVANATAGLQIIDVSDPQIPQIIGSIDSFDATEGVVVVDNTAFVSDGNAGLQIVDVTDPRNPIIIGSIDTPGDAEGISIIGNTAYVADGPAGLQVIDISDPTRPEILGSVGTPDTAFGIFAKGDTAFVADGQSGLQIIDISDPSDPEIMGYVDTPGAAWRVEVVENIAYVADFFGGMQIIDVVDRQHPKIIESKSSFVNIDNSVFNSVAYAVDGFSKLVITTVPFELSPVTVNSPTSVSVTIPSPQQPGQYTLRVFNASESDERSSAVSFLEPTTVAKAIIVAGGGPSTANWRNYLWDGTQTCTDYAYRALLYQGYDRENIQYLTAGSLNRDVIPNDGFSNDIDGFADLNGLENAFLNWAVDTDSPDQTLLVYLVDHGGDGTFRLNVDQHVTAEEMDGWMDTVQETITGRLIFIYDACQSGTFLPKLTPPAGKQRIVISSASDEPAIFLRSGGHSFSFQFWAKVFSGADLRNAFLFGKNMMRSFQTAQLDGNGNGIGNEKDENLSEPILIGRGMLTAPDMPTIESVSDPITLTGDTSARIVAKNVVQGNGLARVWAVIAPPDFDAGSPDNPITELPEIDLTDSDHDGNYEGIYNDFTLSGTYQITVYAADSSGTLSLPKSTTVTQTQDYTIKGDVSGNGIVDLPDAVLALQVISGLNPSVRPDYKTAGVDINGDDRIGMAEALFCLAKLAGK